MKTGPALYRVDGSARMLVRAAGFLFALLLLASAVRAQDAAFVGATAIWSSSDPARDVGNFARVRYTVRAGRTIYSER